MYDELEEKQAIKNVLGDLGIAALWIPQVHEVTSDTPYHHIRAWREPDKNGTVIVHITIKKVR